MLGEVRVEQGRPDEAVPLFERAIRIDMLERLADLLRAQDSRAGFEATPDMLSITGMTLEQFADLMQGLGYGAERGERVKQRPAPSMEASAEASFFVARETRGVVTTKLSEVEYDDYVLVTWRFRVTLGEPDLLSTKDGATTDDHRLA